MIKWKGTYIVVNIMFCEQWVSWWLVLFLKADACCVYCRIRADFRANCKGSHNPQTSSVYWELNVHDWQVKFAPAPENIYW